MTADSTGPAPARHGTCRHSGACGGCSQQHVPYADQLTRKRERLQTLLRKTLGRAAPDVATVLGHERPDGSGPWGFRHKVSFVFGLGSGGRGLAMGHYATGSNRLIPVAECPVHSDRGNRVAFALRDALAAAGIPPAGPRLDGVLRHILVRTTLDQRQAVAMLVVTRNDKRLRAPIRRFLAGPDAPDGLLVNVHDRPGPYMIGRETLVITGRGQVRETALGPAYLISPTAFFQTNVEAAEVLLRTVLEGVPDKPPTHVLDVYSGGGFFGIPLAQRGHLVTMIEENAQAVRDAAENIKANRLAADHVRLICARAEEALVPGRGRSAAVRGVGVAILDPPRDGCPAAVLSAVFDTVAPPRVLYVSCNPEALARELPVMYRAGYEATLIQPIDMFPHTEHIETVAVLQRNVRVRPSSSGR